MSEYWSVREGDAFGCERLGLRDSRRRPALEKIRNGELAVYSWGCLITDPTGQRLAELVAGDEVGKFTVSAAELEVVFPQQLGSSQAEKPRGGRPREFDWEAAILEMVRHVESGGDWSTVAALTSHLQTWFQDRFQREPAESEIKKRARAFRQAMGGEN